MLAAVPKPDCGPRVEAGRRRRRARVAAGLVLLTVLMGNVAACGGSGEEAGTDGPPVVRATLVLDFVPNAVHAGIYRAAAAGYYENAGLDLEIVEPSSTADTLRLIVAGKADLGIADGIDLAGLIERGGSARGVMAVVQRPLGGIITRKSSGIEDPAQLVGERVGVTGIPSDFAVLDAVVSDAGGDPEGVDAVAIGFRGVQALRAGRVAAFTGYVPADATQLEVDGVATRSFPLDEYGGPRYPGLVVFTTEEEIERESAVVGAFVHATVHGYEDTLADPARSLSDLLAANPELDPELAAAQLAAYEPLFLAGASAYGSFDRSDVESLSSFLLGAGLISEPIGFDRYATNSFLPGA